MKNHPGLVSIQYLLLSQYVSVLIRSLNTVNFRGHKLTYLKKVTFEKQKKDLEGQQSDSMYVNHFRSFSNVRKCGVRFL